MSYDEQPDDPAHPKGTALEQVGASITHAIEAGATYEDIEAAVWQVITSLLPQREAVLEDLREGYEMASRVQRRVGASTREATLRDVTAICEATVKVRNKQTDEMIAQSKPHTVIADSDGRGIEAARLGRVFRHLADEAQARAEGRHEEWVRDHTRQSTEGQG